MKKTLSLLVVAIIALTSSINANAWTDRNTFNLKGPVKAVYKNDNDYATLKFDEEGSLIITEEGCFIERYKNNRIGCVGPVYNYYFFSYYYYFFSYNKKGQVSKITHESASGTGETTTYTYNTKGLIISKHTSLFESESTNTTTYTYQKFDKYGNWIKRTAKTKYRTEIQTRTITYY